VSTWARPSPPPDGCPLRGSSGCSRRAWRARFRVSKVRSRLPPGSKTQQWPDQMWPHPTDLPMPRGA